MLLKNCNDLHLQNCRQKEMLILLVPGVLYFWSAQIVLPDKVVSIPTHLVRFCITPPIPCNDQRTRKFKQSKLPTCKVKPRSWSTSFIRPSKNKNRFSSCPQALFVISKLEYFTENVLSRTIFLVYDPIAYEMVC